MSNDYVVRWEIGAQTPTAHSAADYADVDLDYGTSPVPVEGSGVPPTAQGQM